MSELLLWSYLLECLLIYLRKRNLGGFTSLIIQRKSPEHEVAVQGLKSRNAMTVRGLILLSILSSETNEISAQLLPDFRSLTLKIVKHNSQYIEPAIIIFKVIWYVYNVPRWHRTTRSSALLKRSFFCNISTCFVYVCYLDQHSWNNTRSSSIYSKHASLVYDKVRRTVYAVEIKILGSQLFSFSSYKTCKFPDSGHSKSWAGFATEDVAIRYVKLLTKKPMNNKTWKQLNYSLRPCF